MNSLELLNKYTPGGSQTLSKMANRYPSVYPKVLTHGKAGHVFDERGKEYIDLISGLGAVSVGYCNPYIDKKVVEQVARGVSFSLPTRLEALVAKKLTELIPWTEQWRFGKTGTDGVLMAVRAARAYTGRKKILTAGYHGCTDHFECLGTRRAGMLDLTQYTKRFEELPDVSDISYAAVVLEPFILSQQITEKIRQWCNITGTLLIADEVVTGGRFDGFTASDYIGIEPDLIVVGKGLANGFPLCAVGGKQSIMATFARDDFFASGTFGGEAVSLAAALATLPLLDYSIKNRLDGGFAIQDAFNDLFSYWNISCDGYPTRLDFRFNCVTDKYKFWQEMCKRGVLVGYNNFIMSDHTDRDVDTIICAMLEVGKIFDKVDLEGELPSEAVKKHNG